MLRTPQDSLIESLTIEQLITELKRRFLSTVATVLSFWSLFVQSFIEKCRKAASKGTRQEPLPIDQNRKKTRTKGKGSKVKTVRFKVPQDKLSRPIKTSTDEATRFIATSLPQFSDNNSALLIVIYNLMLQQKLRFSGASGEDPEEFLTRIEECRARVPITDIDLLRCLPLFLSGIALQWFCHHQWQPWSVFKQEWRIRFLEPGLQFYLREEIEEFIQVEGETVENYLSCIRFSFSRLEPPWPLEKQLEYACRNMRPRLQFDASSKKVEDFETLERVARDAHRLLSEESLSRNIYISLRSSHNVPRSNPVFVDYETNLSSSSHVVANNLAISQNTNVYRSRNNVLRSNSSRVA